jgi:hypothetical protein
LADEVELGVFETLKALEQFDIAPFESGYEGSAYNDFVGRLAGWGWPEQQSRSTHLRIWHTSETPLEAPPVRLVT